ncbi:MAG: choice-of-anchor D domain-containing protein [Bryobacteraceae bacterium]
MPKPVRLALCLATLTCFAVTGRGATSVMFVPGQFSSVFFTEQSSTQIAADAQGNVYVPDSYVDTVYRYSLNPSQKVIFAGTPYRSWGGPADGGPATSAVLDSPSAITIDRQGNSFIADSWHNTIRRVDAATGIISTVASLNQPNSLAADSAGNIYATSASQRNVVYRISAGSGTVSVLAGTGISGYTGDGGLASQATLNVAFGLVMDVQGNSLYVADLLNDVIRKIDLTSNIITTVAGTGTAGYSGDGGPATSAKLNNPDQIALDAAGDLYISDGGNNVIRRVSAFDHRITTIAGGGSLFTNGNALATGSSLGVDLFRGGGLALDANGNLWINGFYGTQLVTAAAQPALFAATLIGHSAPSQSYAMTNISGSLMNISGVQISGTNRDDFTQTNDCPAQLQPGASCSIEVSFTPVGSGTRSAVVEVLGDGPESPRQIPVSGVATGVAPMPTFAFTATPVNGSVTNVLTLPGPTSGGANVLALLAYGNDYHVSELTCSAGTCTVSVSFQPTAPGVRRDALELKDADGSPIATQYLSGVGNGAQLVFRPGGQFGSAANEQGNPSIDYFIYGATMDPAGTIYLSDSVANAVFRWDGPNHRLIPVAGNGGQVFGGYSGDGGPGTNATLRSPLGLATDSAGNLYIADSGNHVIRRLDRTSGIISTFAGIGIAGNTGENGLAIQAAFQSPSELTVDDSGNVFISDKAANVIRRVDARTSNISRIAGTGTAGYAGDGGAAVNAQLNYPRDLAIGSDGNLYFSDSGNNVVRMVNLLTGNISTVAGTGTRGSSGDGGPAISAQLDGPTGLVFDPAGSLYVSSGDLVREITPTRDRISTLSTPVYDPTGPLLMDTSGNLYVISSGGFIAFTGTPDPITFPDTPVGSSSGRNQSLVLENVGSSPVEGNFIALGGDSPSDFALSSSCASGIAPGGRCILTVGFQPQNGGTRTAVISASPAPSISLRGNGTFGIPAVSSILLFGNVTVANPRGPVRLMLSNRGGAALTISSVAIIGPNAGDFTFTSNCQQSLASGFSCTLQVTLTASAVGLRSATLVVNTSGQPSTVQVALSGTGMEQHGTLSASASRLNFTVSAPGSQSGPQSISITNTGSFAVRFVTAPAVDSTSVTTVSNTCLQVSGLAPGASCTLTLQATADRVPVTSYIRSTYSNDVENEVAFSIPVTAVATPSEASLLFVPITPCRVTDTRNSDGPFGGPIIQGNTTREIVIPRGGCGIPSIATAYALNITAVPAGDLGFLTVWPSGQPKPLVSLLNSENARTKANAAIVQAGADGGINVFATNDTHVVVDVNGYFIPVGSDSGLAFYPLPPCRAADTRNEPNAVGLRTILAGMTRDFRMLGGTCNIPGTAQAYSLNFTAIPKTTLSWLSVWPSGIPKPLVSTLNATTGTVVANAAIVPAGRNGNISAFVTDDTDLVIDINGYFAPPADGALYLHTMTPCRALDTRNLPGGNPVSSTIVLDPGSSNCGVQAIAQTYVGNVTVVPSVGLTYLTIWPDTQFRPIVSTLNAYDGSVTSNMAIVPTVNGSIDLFVTDPTHVIFDLAGYFAP